jgi:replicative DNA helicase
LGADNNFGYNYKDDFEERFKFVHRNIISTGWPRFDAMTKGGLGKKELGVVIASTGCHAKDTDILMFNGQWKKVQDIIIGDKLMGPDSKERNVLNLHRGREQMARIIPKKGKPFEVNLGHILSLTNDRKDEIINISVRDFLKTSNCFQNSYKLYKPRFIDFQDNNKELLIQPYLLGLMLGDGSIRKKNLTFTTFDKVLEDYVEQLPYKKSKMIEGSCRFSSDTDLYRNLEHYNLMDTLSGTKFIPHDYKVSSRENRMKILAGLMDTDGSLSHHVFDYISKSKQLSHDVFDVASSLGFKCVIAETQKSCQNGFTGTYWRVTITGELQEIPTLLERKQDSKKESIRKTRAKVAFRIELIGDDDYYGFEVDGDKLYVMENYWVSHNSGKSMILVHLGAQALMQGKNVVYYTLELTETSIANRFDSCLTGIPLDNLEKSKDKVFETIKDVKGSLIIKEYPTKTASVMTLKNHLERLRSSGFKPDLVLVDYADLLSTKSQSGQKWNDLEGLYEDLRATAQIFNVSIVTASQTNRSGINAEVVTLESISDAFSKCFVADLIITLSRTSKDKMENTGRLYVAKNRNGADGLVLPLYMDTSKVFIDVLDQEPESVEDTKKSGEHKAAISLKQKFNQVKDSLTKTEINGEE